MILINGYRTDYPTLPAGIGYVAQAVEDAGFNYDICDVNFQTNEQILHLVRNKKPKYIGLGTMTHEVDKNYNLLVSIRNLIPDITIILGGPHAIAAGKLIFQECSAIDVVIQGEGEESLIKLLSGIPLHKIPGILTKHLQNEVASSKYLDVNVITFPKYNKFDITKYGNIMQIASSRGCIYQCAFCGAPKFLGNKWRAFKVERMIEEFEYWYKRGYRQFYFSDSLFALNKKRVLNFCQYIVESNYNDVVFTADGIRADHLSVELLQFMKKANFKKLTLGVESVNDITLEFFNKGESFSKIDNAIKIADSLGFDITIYLIIGAPVETYNDALKSIHYPIKYKNIISATFSKLQPIKGTPYYEYALKHKLIPNNYSYYPVMEAYGFNKRNVHGICSSIVEQVWERVYPEIGKVVEFLKKRKIIRDCLIWLGIENVNIDSINKLTQFFSLPVISIVFDILFRLIHKIKKLKQKFIF